MAERFKGLTLLEKILGIAVGLLTVTTLLLAGVSSLGGRVADRRALQEASAVSKTTNDRQDQEIRNLQLADKALRDQLNVIETNTCITVVALTHTDPERCKQKLQDSPIEVP